MKEKKRRKKIFAAGIVLILIVVYAVRVMAVNTSYKKEEYTVQKGESIEVQGMRISVLESEMKKMSAQSKWANLQDESEEGYDMVLTVQYENISDQPISRCIVTETMLQSGGWTNGMNGMHFMEINEESPEMAPLFSYFVAQSYNGSYSGWTSRITNRLGNDVKDQIIYTETFERCV